MSDEKKTLSKQLYKAINEANLRDVYDLIERGIDVNYQGGYLYPPIIACFETRQRSSIIIKHLVSTGAKLDICTPSGYLLLKKAMDMNFDLVKYFVQYGANIKLVDGYGNNILSYACINQKKHNILYLIRKGVSINHVNENGDTPFTIYFSTHNIKKEWNTISELLKYVDDIDVVNHAEFSLLHLAIYRRHNDIALKLIKMGADINQPDGHRITPLMRAIMVMDEDNTTIINNDIGYTTDDEDSPAYNAEDDINNCQDELNFDSQLKLISKLAEMEPDFEMEDSDGNNALTLAVGISCPEVVEILLENGANPNVVNEHNYTPLMSSVSATNYEIVELLLEYGADPNQCYITTIKDVKYNPLYIAAKVGNYELIDLLLKYGAKLSDNIPQIDYADPILLGDMYYYILSKTNN